MKLALVLNAIHPAIGGVLIRGEKGTGKSTAVRALARLLPEQNVVADCVYRCDPNAPEALCSDCRDRIARGETLPRARRRMRVVELPINASEDRVVGAIDIEAAIKSGERRFEPGVLAEANRNILYVDEVNLLDDHLVDVLLDAAAMGVNVVEREGISIWHPARFILVGTMNPEEGDLRPQLLDRFGLAVDVEGIKDIGQRVQIVERREEWESDPAGFSQRFADEDAQIGQRIAEGCVDADGHPRKSSGRVWWNVAPRRADRRQARVSPSPSRQKGRHGGGAGCGNVLVLLTLRMRRCSLGRYGKFTDAARPSLS